MGARKDVPLEVLEDLAGDMCAPVAYDARDRLEKLIAQGADRSESDH